VGGIAHAGIDGTDEKIQQDENHSRATKLPDACTLQKKQLCL